MPYHFLFALLFCATHALEADHDSSKAFSPQELKAHQFIGENVLKRVEKEQKECLEESKRETQKNELEGLLQELKGKPPVEIFNIANRTFHEENYEEAIETYRALNTLYPFNEYAEKSKLFTIQALYNSNKMAETISAIDKFVVEYPASEDRELATYLKAKAYFYDQDGVLGWVHHVSNGKFIDFAERKDNIQLAHSESQFLNFLKEFPEGKYHAEAEQELKLIQRLGIKKELNIAQFYFERANYRAAYDRLTQVLKQYPNALEVLPTTQAKQLQELYQSAGKELGLVAENAV